MPALLSLILLAGLVPVQEPSPEGPLAVGLPPDGYRSPATVIERLRRLGARPGVRVEAIAASPTGQPVLIASFGAEPGAGRPELLIVADPDGTRPIASQLALALCEHLAAGGSPLLERATVHVLAVANPDAATQAFAGKDAQRGAPRDEDRDARLDEDPAQDLDGDGLALWMRVPRTGGAWLPEAADPRAKRARDLSKGELGAFEMMREGLDADSDRAIAEDGRGGIQLEANWPHRWREHRPESGPYALSEPETRGLAGFVLARPGIALAIVLGSEDSLAAPPKGAASADTGTTEVLEADAYLHAVLGARLYEKDAARPRGAEAGHGNLADWLYFQAGIPTLESAVWSPPLDVAVPEGKDEAGEEAKLLRWADSVYGGRGFVAWRPFEHPQLGAVEIGGWKPLVAANPPIGELPGLVDRWSGFVDSLAGDFAQLSWEQVQVTALGGNVFEARATLVNTGLMATSTNMGLRTRRPLPARVQLELPEG
ncbi:MAG TPA: hypothetical protein VGC54_09505, partial [Planctomycetota bacterium]